MRVDVYADNGELLFTNTAKVERGDNRNSVHCSPSDVTNALINTLWHHDLVQPRKGMWRNARQILFNWIEWESDEEFHQRREWARHHADPEHYPRPGTDEWRAMWEKITSAA
jgi:hypothetical protein